MVEIILKLKGALSADEITIQKNQKKTVCANPNQGICCFIKRKPLVFSCSMPFVRSFLGIKTFSTPFLLTFLSPPTAIYFSPPIFSKEEGEIGKFNKIDYFA